MFVPFIPNCIIKRLLVSYFLISLKKLQVLHNWGPNVTWHVQGLETRMGFFRKNRRVRRKENIWKSIRGKWLKIQRYWVTQKKSAVLFFKKDGKTYFTFNECVRSALNFFSVEIRAIFLSSSNTTGKNSRAMKNDVSEFRYLRFFKWKIFNIIKVQWTKSKWFDIQNNAIL